MASPSLVIDDNNTLFRASLEEAVDRRMSGELVAEVSTPIVCKATSGACAR